MKTFLLMCTLGVIANFSKVDSQEFVILNNGEATVGPKPGPQTSPPRPYSPLPPMQLPPYFQNLGITLPPPPPPPLYFQQVNDPFQHLQLGDVDRRFFFSFLDQIKQLLFPRPTTVAPSPRPTPITQNGDDDEEVDEENEDGDE